jgi:hypothetical protein
MIRRPGTSIAKEGKPMHAVTVKVSINDIERADSQLRERIIPMVSQMPGFIAGYWLEPQDGHGASHIFFESEDQAKAMVEGAKAQAGQPDAPVTFDEIGVRGVHAHA